MTKIDIFSGFLGAGKTTLIKKMIQEGFKNETLVLIENEFGEIGIDGGFLKDAGITVTEMNSGCICCSLVGDFGVALKKVIETYHPDRILIEPSGVGKLSDVIKAVKNIKNENLVINSATTVVDAKRFKMYLKNFGEFFIDQIAHAKCIVLSHTQGLSDEKLSDCMHHLKEHNESAVIVSTDWDKLSHEKLLHAIEGTSTIQESLDALKHEEDCPICSHHHHEHEHHHDCECGHHHEHEHDHKHHHHDCGCEHHEHHHHHHADEVFQSVGFETAKKYTKDELSKILSHLEDEASFGHILRAKGIVNADGIEWLHFDYIPGASDVRFGSPDITGRICIIGSEIKEDALRNLFGI